MNNRVVVAIIALLALTGGMTATTSVLGFRFEYQLAGLIGSLVFIAVVVAVALERRQS